MDADRSEHEIQHSVGMDSDVRGEESQRRRQEGFDASESLTQTAWPTRHNETHVDDGKLIAGLQAIRGWSWSGRSVWYQPKDEAGRFTEIPESARVRQPEPRPKRKRSPRGASASSA
jgi:hypothetical protein